MTQYLAILWAILSFLVITHQFVKSEVLTSWTGKIQSSTTVTLSLIAEYSDKKALSVIANSFLALSIFFVLVGVGLHKYLAIELPILKSLSGFLFYFYCSVYIWSNDKEGFVRSLFKDFKLISSRILFWVSFLACSYFVYESLVNNIEITDELVKTVYVPTTLILVGVAFSMLFMVQGGVLAIFLLPALILLVYIMLLVRVSRLLSENNGDRLSRLLNWLLGMVTILMGLDTYVWS